MIKNCPMRHENGNCIPAGGFCTANKNICEALLNAYRIGKAQLSSEGATSDLISRQAVIDALHTWFRDGFNEDKWWNSTHVLAAIEGLPSVQQEHKWETCFECPLSHGCPKIKGCTNEQAVDYAGEIPGDCPLSAQPEPKEGHWIGKYPTTHICSECGWLIPDSKVKVFAYCPNCGAKMKGERQK